MKLKLISILMPIFYIGLLLNANSVVIHDGDSGGNAASTNFVINVVSNETTRATNAEGVIQSNLTAEITRATNAEVAVQSNLTAEIARATNAEATVQSNLTAEIARATNAEATVQSNLTAEIARATNAEVAVQNNLNVYSNRIASIALGSEGIRQIGALGGYTLDEFFEDTAVCGPARDCPVFTYAIAPTHNLSVLWTTGDVYSPVAGNGYFHLIAGSNSLTDNAVNYAYWNNSNPHVVQWTTGTRPDVASNITFATFVTSLGMILQGTVTTPVGDLPLKADAGHSAVMPSLIVDGVYFTPIGTNLNQIIQAGGTEYHNMSEKLVHSSKNLTNYGMVPPQTFLITYYHTNTSGFGYSITNQLPIDMWDNGTNLVACVVSNWYRGVFVSMGGAPEMDWIYPQQEYTNYASALAGSDPTLPAGFVPYIPLCTAYIFQGGDTSLRQESDYWVDRRFMIRRGSIAAGSGGGSSTIPSLYQVLLQGPGTGGILPSGMGNPSANDQAANKGYVDSTINKINANKAYVDADSGNDGTALLESSILPFKTIQAAINAAAVVASDTERYVVVISPDIFTENITMKNYVGIVGIDTESTRIIGTVTYPSTFTDVAGAEIQQITIVASNTPALVINMGADDAYTGLRSCYIKSTYDNNASNKSLIVINKGLVEIYATTYNELNIIPTNGSGNICHAQIYEHVTDTGNEGLSQLMSFNSSCIISSEDNNDTISMLYSHLNTDTECFNVIQGGSCRFYLDTPGITYSNKLILVHTDFGVGTALAMGKFLKISIAETNDLSLYMASSSGNIQTSKTNVKDCRIRVIGGSISSLWIGQATTTNDSIYVANSDIVQTLDKIPTRYTNSGFAGSVYYNSPNQNGEYEFGGGINLANINTTIPAAPLPGHIKIYIDSTTGLEQPYFMDSTGTKVRITRDNVFTAYNAETNTLQENELVCIVPGVSGTAHYIKRSSATNLTTLTEGIVCHTGGIAAGTKGRIIRLGRTELTMNTASWASGDKLYTSATVSGGITNVAPSEPAYSQRIGKCINSATNGVITFFIYPVDTLGNQLPSYYLPTNGPGNGLTAVNAVTVGGYTAQELTSAQLTYYVWGSLVGPYTNFATKMAKIASPVGSSTWTSTVAGVTNLMYLGYASVNTNETPKILKNGRSTAHLVIERDGDATDHTMRLNLDVYDSTGTNLLVHYISENSSVPVGKTHVEFACPITNETAIIDYSRYIVVYFRTISGWAGTETIKVYSQDGELTYIELPGSGSGVYVSKEEMDNAITVETDRATASETVLQSNINAVVSGTNWSKSVALQNVNLGGNGVTNGSLKDNANNITVDWNARNLLTTNAFTTVDWRLEYLSHNGTLSVNWGQRYVVDTIARVSIDWGNRSLYDADANGSINWNNRQLLDTNEAAVLSWNTLGVDLNNLAISSVASIGFTNGTSLNGTKVSNYDQTVIQVSILNTNTVTPTQLTNEATLRNSGDTNLQSNINAASNALNSAITNEAVLRGNGDTNLQSNINAASNALNSAITNEAVLRGNGDTNLQNNIIVVSNMITTVAFDAYVTNGWTTLNDVLGTVPFVNNGSTGCFTNNRYAFVPPQSGWYNVSVYFQLTSGNDVIDLYLARCNSSSTNNIQRAGIGAAANSRYAVLNSIFYDNGQTNWYIIRCQVGAALAVTGGTNGITRFNGHFIGK